MSTIHSNTFPSLIGLNQDDDAEQYCLFELCGLLQVLFQKLELISHPPIEEITKHLCMLNEKLDNEWNRYGEYLGWVPVPTGSENNKRSLNDLFVVLPITPYKIDQVPNELWRVIIIGVTKQGQQVRVDINPFKELDNLGYLWLED